MRIKLIGKVGRRLRTSNSSATGGFQFRGLALSFEMVHSPLDRGVIASFGSLRDLGAHRIQINVRAVPSVGRLHHPTRIERLPDQVAAASADGYS
jgi:hypothetical protein